MRLEEPGVWDHHFELVLDFTEGFILRTHSEARVRVNGRTCDRVRLRSGSVHQALHERIGEGRFGLLLGMHGLVQRVDRFLNRLLPHVPLI